MIVVQTYNLSNKSEMLASVQLPEGKEGPKLVTLTTDLVSLQPWIQLPHHFKASLQ